jgi:hypothetical protein
MKELAPYGDHLNGRILHGYVNETAIIFIGEKAKEKAENFQPQLPCALYLPWPSSPYKYRWPLYQAEVYLLDTGRSSASFIKQCVECFFSYGASKVRYHSNYWKIFRKEPK